MMKTRSDMDFLKWMQSQKTEIQQAFAEHVSGLKSALTEERRMRRHAENLLEITRGEDGAMDEAEFSADNKRDLLQKALRRRNPSTSSMDSWIRDLFDDYLVYQGPDAKQFRV